MPPPFKGRQQIKNVGLDGKHIPSQKAGRKGGGQRKERTIPPPDAALPPHINCRPTDCDPDSAQAKKYCRAYAATGDNADAARIAGYHPSTTSDWLLWGEEGREPYRTFAERAIAAHAEVAELAARAVADKQPDKWLRHNRPAKWGDKVAIEHSLSAETLAEIERTRHLTDEQLAEYVRERKSET